MSKVLIYNLPPEKDAKVKMLCRKFGFDSRSIEKAEYGYTLGYLLGLSEDDSVRDGEDFEEEMLYIAELRGGMLNLFLDQLRRKKLSVPLRDEPRLYIPRAVSRAMRRERRYREGYYTTSGVG